MNDTHHQDTVRDAFDRWSSHWSSHYVAGGRMEHRVRQFAEALDIHASAGCDILDFGCGTGEIAFALTARGFRVSACDGSGQMLERARRTDTAGAIAWHLVPSDMPLPFADGSFDAVVTSSVLEYIAEPRKHLAEFARILRPGGVLLATVPDPAHPIRRREALKIPFARFAPTWAILRHTRWSSEFTYLRLSVSRPPLAEWVGMLKQAGFAAPDLPPPGTAALVLLAAKRAS